MRINLIAAVGRRGQLGLNGKLPWTKDREDLNFFQMATRRNIVVMGSRTFDPLFENAPVWNDRMVLRMDRENTMIYDEGEHKGYLSPGVDRIILAFHEKKVDLFIAGGQQIFEAWMPHVRRFFITQVDYDGEADTWLKSPWAQS